MRVFALIFILSIQLECSNRKNPGSETSNLSGTIEAPDKVVSDFYKWYLDNHYNVDHKLIPPNPVMKNGQIYLDTAEYMLIVRKCGFFSERYIKRELEIFRQCNEDLQRVDVKKVEECGCSPAQFTTRCGFVFAYPWLFHQGEDTNDTSIRQFAILGDSASVDIDLLMKKADTTSRYQTLRVILLKEVRGWKIEEIENLVDSE